MGTFQRPDLFDPHTVHYHGFPNASAIFDGLPESAIATLTGHPAYVSFVEAARAAAPKVALKKIGNFVQTEVLRGATVHGLTSSFTVTPEQVAEWMPGFLDGTPIQVGDRPIELHGEHTAGQ